MHRLYDIRSLAEQGGGGVVRGGGAVCGGGGVCEVRSGLMELE